MDAAELKLRIEASREFTFEKDEIGLKLRIPTEMQMRQAMRQVHSKGEPLDMGRLQPVVMNQAIVGWTGVRMCHLADDLPTDPMAFAPELVEYVFDKWPELYDDGFRELVKRYDERKSKKEAEIKN